MQRVLIVGPCGAGKSTLSFELAQRTGLPLYHMDRLHWKSGWQESSPEELVGRLMPILERNRWIIDGNYGGTMELRLRRADTVIFLDPPRRVYRWRVLKRALKHYGRTRPDMTEGCPERFDLTFLRYVWTFHKRPRERLLAQLQQVDASATLITLRHAREVQAFLATCAR